MHEPCPRAISHKRIPLKTCSRHFVGRFFVVVVVYRFQHEASMAVGSSVASLDKIFMMFFICLPQIISDATAVSGGGGAAQRGASFIHETEGTPIDGELRGMGQFESTPRKLRAGQSKEELVLGHGIQPVRNTPGQQLRFFFKRRRIHCLHCRRPHCYCGIDKISL